MSRRSIENYIPKVLKVLDRSFTNGDVPSSYNGYISSFGASIIQSGLLPTLALFENTNASSKENKEYLSYIIVQVLTDRDDDISLIRYVLDKDEQLMKQKILDISIALKLSIRTFKLTKDNQNE